MGGGEDGCSTVCDGGIGWVGGEGSTHRDEDVAVERH